MILRKPYAFLIKYFKIIHIIIAVLTGYIIYRAYDIMTFFNNYILNDYSGTFYKGFSTEYISFLIYLVIIIIIIGLCGILFLFIYKKKPAKMYIISIGYFIFYIIFLNILKNAMVGLETTLLSAQTARIYRDLSLLSLAPLFVFLIMYIVRGLGFNIHKFNFENDIKELEIASGDNEEIELTFRSDGVKLKRNVRRFIREFIYYIKENKLIFTLICIVLTISIGVLLFKALPELINERHSQNENFNIYGINYNIEDSIISNLDYKGEITNKDGYFVVIKLRIENNMTYDFYVDYNMFRLEVNNRYVYPTVDKSASFIDYAVSHTSKLIKANSNNTYAIAFKIKKDEVKKNYRIKISAGSAISKAIKIGKYHYVTITPIIINKIVEEKKVNLNEEIKFTNSYLGNSTFKAANVIITDKYIYDYEDCYNDKCTTYKGIITNDFHKNSKTLLVFDYEYEIDKEVPFYETAKTVDGFLENFAKLKYIDNNNEKVDNIKNITPSKLKGKIVLEVPSKVRESKEVYLTITIRNKEYSIKLK